MKLKIVFPIAAMIMIVLLSGCLSSYKELRDEQQEMMDENEREMDEFIAEGDAKQQKMIDEGKFRQLCFGSEWKRTDNCEVEPTAELLTAAERYLGTTDIIEMKVACMC